MTTFNEPWMDNLNQDLLIRYWMRKETMKPLRVTQFGVPVYLYKTGLGIFNLVQGSFLPPIDYKNL